MYNLTIGLYVLDTLLQGEENAKLLPICVQAAVNLTEIVRFLEHHHGALGNLLFRPLSSSSPTLRSSHHPHHTNIVGRS